jgi:hypothetical protein
MRAVGISAERRPIPAVHRVQPELFPAVSWVDYFGLDSPYDYDPFWKRCAELKVPVMSHSGGTGYTNSSSPSHFTYNHIGRFAAAQEGMCKALVLGGVTRRFPTLNLAFLEGGVSWACRLYADLVGHWQKRNLGALREVDPAELDRDLFLDLHRRYGDRRVQATLDRVLEVGAGLPPTSEEDPAGLDDFAAWDIERAEEIRELFVPRLFFGCEADDPTNALAFAAGLWPFGARLNAVFGSDIGHWDVPDMREVVEEAYELVEHGHLSETDFRDFSFGNAVKLFAGANPEFFTGTRVEKAVQRELNGARR